MRLPGHPSLGGGGVGGEGGQRKDHQEGEKELHKHCFCRGNGQRVSWLCTFLERCISWVCNQSISLIYIHICIYVYVCKFISHIHSSLYTQETRRFRFPFQNQSSPKSPNALCAFFFREVSIGKFAKMSTSPFILTFTF